MNTYIAVVFASDEMADQALRKLWRLDEEGTLTVHGAALLRRDAMGDIRVAHRNSDLGLRTAIGVGLGALIGIAAGPMGAAIGIAGAAGLSVATGMGVGALTGAALGATADAMTEARRETAADEAFFTLPHGHSALVADVTEDSVAVLDAAMRPYGGSIHRRLNDAATRAAFGANAANGYLYPYYAPPVYL